MAYVKRKTMGRRPVRKVARKRPVYRKKKGVTTLAKKVNRLVYQMKPEIKNISYNLDTTVGQVDANFNIGAIISDLTPTIAAGVARDQRVGNTVKLSGMFFQGQLIQQQNSIDSGRISIEIWKHKAKEVGMTGTTLNEIYTPNHFSDNVDLMSRRNQNFFSDYICIRKQRVYVPNDQLSQTRYKNFQFGVKFKNGHTVRYSDAGAVINGQLFLVVRSASGNKSIATANTAALAIPFTGVQTGWRYLHNVVNYYTDN